MNKLFLTALLCCAAAQAQTVLSGKALGQQLFFDPVLSHSQEMHCATCHQPERAFIDARSNAGQGMVSLGDDGQIYGFRNAPSILYAAQTPEFHFDAQRGEYAGGFFWDGRAATLAEQIRGPILTAFEMNMADEMAVVARLQAVPLYERSFRLLYGANVFELVGKPGIAYQLPRAFAELGNVIAAYERSEELNRFNSRYDRFLRGEVQLSAQEELGRQIFFDRSRSSCSACHQQREEGAEREMFSRYAYYNLGLPPNRAAYALAKRGDDNPDIGLQGNFRVNSRPQWRGKFKTPSLRNVAVSAPYFHNGLIRDLREVIAFHQRFNEGREGDWAAPEVPETLDRALLSAPPLSGEDIDALIAFLRALTDQEYEHLLE